MSDGWPFSKLFSFVLPMFWSAYLDFVRILFWFKEWQQYIYSSVVILLPKITYLRLSHLLQPNCNGRDLVPLDCSYNGWWHATGSV
jgi:hypothetical protein